MTDVVWKWPLSLGRNDIEMPRGARALSAQVQGNEPVLWALCDKLADLEGRTVWLVPTGALVNQGGPFM